MVEYEADDGLAAGAAIALADTRVEQVFICTPDKDLAQCVVADRVVQFDRRKRLVIDRAGVVEKFGVEGPGGRLSRRLPGLEGMGRQVGRGRVGALRLPGGDSRSD